MSPKIAVPFFIFCYGGCAWVMGAAFEKSGYSMTGGFLSVELLLIAPVLAYLILRESEPPHES